MKTSDIELSGATPELVSTTAATALSLKPEEASRVTVKDISGNSGARTYLCLVEDVPSCIVKIQTGSGIMDSHPNTHARVTAAADVMRAHHLAPQIIMKGVDFHVEESAGVSVMKDFFHFDPELAPPDKLAQLLAKIHALPTNWYEPLKERFLNRDARLGNIIRDAPESAPGWCLPWSGFDTGMLLLGVGNPNPQTAQRLLELEVESGVYEKVMRSTAFSPMSAAGKRQVVIHNDFKPDNVLRDPKTGTLTAIDYDLVQVGSAVMDFGLPYMMWLGARFTSFEYRQAFIRDYLEASGQPSAAIDVRAMMLDCEINTIVAFPGLLANIYDHEVPLLRGIKHPTAKAGVEASGPEASPTGLEIVDLLTEAVGQVRADDQLADRCLREGLVCTIFNEEGLGSVPLYAWLKEMQKNRMLRLFGIPEAEGAELFVSEHAKP